MCTMFHIYIGFPPPPPPPPPPPSPPSPPIVLSPYRKLYKERPRRISAIRVWESVDYTSFLSEQIREFLNAMKKLYTPNHKLYEEYYLNQAKQK